MRDEDGHRAMLAAGKAWRKAGRQLLWSDWTLVIGPALMKARAEAVAIAGTNQPRGRGYNTAMAGLLREYGLDGMGETVRAHILRIMEEYADVEEWRARQENPAGLNHPSRVRAKYQRWTTEQEAERLVIEKLKGKGYEVTNANIPRRNNPEFDLICNKNGCKFVVDAKGWEGAGTGWFVKDVRKRKKRQDLIYVLVGWVDDTGRLGRRGGQPKYFILSQDDVRKVYDDFEHKTGRPVGPGPVVSKVEAEPFEDCWDKLPAERVG
jgi:Holliday junction resolvase-like predicted endonuclease